MNTLVSYAFCGIIAACIAILGLKEWSSYKKGHSPLSRLIRRMLGICSMSFTAVLIVIGTGELATGNLNYGLWIWVILFLILSLITVFVDISEEIKRLKNDLGKSCEQDIAELTAKIQELNKSKNS